VNRTARHPGWTAVTAAACTALALGGCAAPAAHREGEELLLQGQYGAGLAKLEEASRLDPSSLRYRADALNQRERIVTMLAEAGDGARRAGRGDEAKKQYDAALAIQPNHERSIAGLRAMDRDAVAAARLQDARARIAAGDPDGARAILEKLLAEDPARGDAKALMSSIDQAAAPEVSASLTAEYRTPMTLEFHDAPLRAIFEAISRSSKLNFVFDRDVKLDQHASIYLRDSTLDAALSFLMETNQLTSRTLDGNSLLVYPADAAKRKDYEAMGVRAFYLRHTDAKTFGSTLKTILKSKDIVVDDKLNLVILHDTWDSIRLAEKLALLQDVEQPEVVLDVEVLEVTRNRLTDLGVHWPDQLTLSALPLRGGTLTLSDLTHLDRSSVAVSPGSIKAGLSSQDADADILANPRIRTHSREKAKIMIGERVPSPVSTATSTGFVSESISYLDVGLKLEVEPVVYPDDEVSIQIGLEVSSITSQSTTTAGSIAYQIGTRNAQTVLRLRNNENTILAGLINDEDRRSANAIPLLGDIPLIGHLFGEHTSNKAKTEIVLSITPHIVRNLPVMPLTALQFDAGTDSVLRSPRPQAPAPAVSAASSPGTSSAGAPRGRASNGRAPSGQAMVRASVRGPGHAREGDEFDVDLDLQSNLPLLSAPSVLGFDPKALQVVDVRPGKFLTQGGGSLQFNQSVDSDGQVSVIEDLVGGVGGLSEDHAVTVRFKVLPNAPSSTKINVLSIAPKSAMGQAYVQPLSPLTLQLTK